MSSIFRIDDLHHFASKALDPTSLLEHNKYKVLGDDMSLIDLLKKIGESYAEARNQPFAKHPLASIIRNELPASVRGLLKPADLENIKVVGSAGKGNWADFPWLAFLHEEVTDSAQSGFYPVFLYEPGMETCCLTLAQGAEALERAYGINVALEVVGRRAADLRNASGSWESKGFSKGPFNTTRRLGTRNKDLSSGPPSDPWSTSVAFGKRYALGSPPSEEELKDDILNMLALYRNVVRNWAVQTRDEDSAVEELSATGELPVGGLDGAMKVASHKKLEVRLRNHKLARAAKRYHGYKCQGCGLIAASSYVGLNKVIVDAHHLRPLSQAPREGTDLTVEDFAVLCPTCHRVIHQLGCPPLAELRDAIADWLKKAHAGDQA